MLSDNHMHTFFSGDSEADPVEMIRTAKKIGLSGMTITDHLDWDYYYEPGLFDLDIEKYMPFMRELAAKESTKDFSVRVGIELGLQEHLASRHDKLLSEFDFDFVIGSLHQVGRSDPYYDDYYEGKSVLEAYREYLSATLSNLAAFPRIDSLGHLDYIARYGQRVAKGRGEDGALRYADFAEGIDAILEFLIGHDIALEVNTGNFRYGFLEPNPSYEILARYHALGGRLLTFGADAHRPEHVGIGFAETVERLKEIGFSSYLVFTGRKAEETAF